MKVSRAGLSIVLKERDADCVPPAIRCSDTIGRNASLGPGCDAVQPLPHRARIACRYRIVPIARAPAVCAASSDSASVIGHAILRIEIARIRARLGGTPLPRGGRAGGQRQQGTPAGARSVGSLFLEALCRRRGMSRRDDRPLSADPESAGSCRNDDVGITSRPGAPAIIGRHSRRCDAMKKNGYPNSLSPNSLSHFLQFQFPSTYSHVWKKWVSQSPPIPPLEKVGVPTPPSRSMTMGSASAEPILPRLQRSPSFRRVRADAEVRQQGDHCSCRLAWSLSADASN